MQFAFTGKSYQYSHNKNALFLVGPRHNPNPSPLMSFCVQKSIDKKLLNFSENCIDTLKAPILVLLTEYMRQKVRLVQGKTDMLSLFEDFYINEMFCWLQGDSGSSKNS